MSKGGLMKPIGNIVLAATLACASQAAIAQTKPVRVCTTELDIHPDEDFRPGPYGPPPIHMRPQALPPDFSGEATAPGTVIVTVPVAWTKEGFEARLRQEECDFVVLTWWEYRGLDVDPTLWPPMLNDDINPAWSMPMQAVPVDSPPIAGAAATAVPMMVAPANIPTPPSAAKWLRHFELDGPGFQRVLTTKGYPYSAAPEKKLMDIAKQMGMEILRVIDSRPRIENLPAAARPSMFLPLGAPPASPELPASESAGTTGDSHGHRTKITLSEPTSHAVINGHDCTPGDSSDACKNVCGGLFGPCKDVEQKLRLQEQHFVLARRLLLEKGVPFEPFTLLRPGGLARLKPVLDQMPEMRQIRREASPSGVIFADTLYLPEGASFGGPTVVIVNHIVYEGRCPIWIRTPWGNIWETNGLYLFPRGESRALDMSLEAALQKGGVTNYGERNPPPFSVIKDLDIPNSCKEIHIGNGAPIHK